MLVLTQEELMEVLAEEQEVGFKYLACLLLLEVILLVLVEEELVISLDKILEHLVVTQLSMVL